MVSVPAPSLVQSARLPVGQAASPMTVSGQPGVSASAVPQPLVRPIGPVPNGVPGATLPKTSALPSNAPQPMRPNPQPTRKSLSPQQLMRDSYKMVAWATALTVGALDTMRHIAGYKANVKALNGMAHSTVTGEWLSNLWQLVPDAKPELADKLAQSSLKMAQGVVPTLTRMARQDLALNMLSTTVRAGATGIVSGLAAFSLTKLLIKHPANPILGWFHELWQPSDRRSSQTQR